MTSKAKAIARWLGVMFSLLAVIFAALGYAGIWSKLRGDGTVAKFANGLDTSYAEDVKRVVYPMDPEWIPLLRIIRTYTAQKLPHDRQPMVFGRGQAITSAKSDVGEWTAPTTPILLIYKEWPNGGNGPIEKGRDFFVVGTLGDLHEWIKRDQADFDFFWRTLIFGGLSACVGVFLALPDKRPIVASASQIVETASAPVATAPVAETAGNVSHDDSDPEEDT